MKRILAALAALALLITAGCTATPEAASASDVSDGFSGARWPTSASTSVSSVTSGAAREWLLADAERDRDMIWRAVADKLDEYREGSGKVDNNSLEPMYDDMPAGMEYPALPSAAELPLDVSQPDDYYGTVLIALPGGEHTMVFGLSKMGYSFDESKPADGKDYRWVVSGVYFLPQ